MTFISGYSIIRNNQIFLDGRVVYPHSPVISPHAEIGGLDTFLTTAYDVLKPGYPKYYKMDRLCQLGFLASEVLLMNHPIKQYPPFAVGVVLSNAHSSLDTDIRYSQAAKKAPSPALFVYTLPNIVTGEICIRHVIKGENAFFITQYFDAELICNYVSQVLLQHSTQACIAGWVDVIGEHHDVFLYLVENERRGLGLEHTPEELKNLKG